MLTLYTAIGYLKFKKGANGNSVPMVINREQEYGLSEHELLLWSCLAFQIHQFHELETEYETRRKRAGLTEALPLSHYLNRLLLRRLIAKGDGLTGVDALYRLLGELYITPVHNPFSARLFTCIQLYTEGKITRKDFGKYLKKERQNAIEKTILKLAQAVPLSTAELVTCVDQGKEVHSSKDVMDTLYHTPDVTCQTLADDAQLHHVQYPVLQAIGNLYLNKQISFQRL
ncbi:cell division protein [Clostridium sp. C105KSO13]|uniref:cell division protein n=1 Tax=Clostridium sp. C105KSO13 TaxID=1776045 RepID=UPI0007408713|nr:cell division protein [Clostridium sp. C105KSO13]CUX25534.1 hypothetical protein BN3456_00827 [Clostridium sp. C105KSO13]